MKVLVIILVGLFLIGAMSHVGDDDSSASPSPSPASASSSSSDPAPIDITAAMVVDVMFGDDSSGSMLNAFCDSYYTLGYDLSLASFSQGYTEPNPSASEVFDEVISRCP